MEDKFILKLVFLLPLLSFCSAWVPSFKCRGDWSSEGSGYGPGDDEWSGEDGDAGWQCRDWRCINPMKRCDGQYDCQGWPEGRFPVPSDEENCPPGDNDIIVVIIFSKFNKIIFVSRMCLLEVEEFGYGSWL